VVSRRGAHGGYALARDAASISFKDVIEAVEGPITLNICVGDLSHCSVSSSCGMHHIWSEGQRRLLDLVATTKLTDLPRARLPAPTLAADGAPAGDRGKARRDLTLGVETASPLVPASSVTDAASAAAPSGAGARGR